MTKSVFFSFHYDNDYWRVNQVRNIGAVEGQPLLEPQEWESVQAQGNAAIEKWIADQMAGTSAVVVLIGSETATRPWVRHEIIKAWNDKRPLVGVHIHGLQDEHRQTDIVGANPFLIDLPSGGTIANYVPAHNPVGADSQAVYASIANNLETWVDHAYRRS